ncbi:hypothetical protein GOV08_00965 [Candidatus Woesearchaeota archaeon]|nr:hypothetical protein [Candidatus Woesearchaeota archaeon]
MALKKEEIEYIRSELKKSKRPLIFFDDDPDGLASFLLFYRYKGEGKGVVVKSTPELGDDFLRKIDEYLPDMIFILDKPMVSQDFIDGCKGKKIIWLDHHVPQKMKGVKYFNPRVHDDKDNRPTSYWAYQVVKQDLWIAMTGIVGDWALPDDAAKKFKKDFPKLLPKEIEKPQDALFGTKIGKISRMFSFLLKGRTTDVNKAVKILTRVKSPNELLIHESPRTKLLFKWFTPMEHEYRKMLSEVDTKDKKMILHIYGETKVSFTADISNELLYKYPDRIIIIGREKNGEMKLSFRSTKVALPPIIKKALDGVEGYGGGHTNACGGNVKKKDFDKFISQFKKQLK